MAKNKKKAKVTAEEKFRRRHYGTARSVFRSTGFVRVAQVSDKTIEFDGQMGDFDDVYVFENVIVFLEYTCHAISKVSDHLKKKKILFSKIQNDPKGFLRYLRKKFNTLDDEISSKYHEDKLIVKIVYCSFNEPSSSVKSNVDEVIYLDYPELKYFQKITNTIKFSARNELLDFLDIDPFEVGQGGKFQNKGSSSKYPGSILPESSSGFGEGYKVVSFYADPAALLDRAYVLRRDGWRGTYESYQRMLQKGKIDSIRKTLKSNTHVFVNNLIATLPSDVHPVDSEGKTVEISKLTETAPVEISLPLRPNSLGIIDGQHRLYSYHETKIDDPVISLLRNQQNLLVTGIIYPNSVSNREKERFEAKLFLTINSNQTNAPTALKQEIEVVLRPFSHTSIGKQVMQKLAEQGPLDGFVQRHFYDSGLLKTTSIVSYGLAPLIKLSGNDSIFSLLNDEKKKELVEQKLDSALTDYIQYCTSEINILLAAVKQNVDDARWTLDKSVNNRILTVTYVNSFLILLRLLIQNKKPTTPAFLKKQLANIGAFKFKDFHSSQYNRMALKMYEMYFK